MREPFERRPLNLLRRVFLEQLENLYCRAVTWPGMSDLVSDRRGHGHSKPVGRRAAGGSGKDRRQHGRHKAREEMLDALRTLGGEAQRRAIYEPALAHAGSTERELAAPPEGAGDRFELRVDHNLSWR